jgi:hypothetical protein
MDGRVPAHQLYELKCWEEDFPSFANAVASKCGGLFDNITAFVDGHFVPVCRPGGQHNVNQSILQLILWNRYYKAHSLKFICTLLPNGMLLPVCKGAFAGKEHDSPCFKSTNVSWPPPCCCFTVRCCVTTYVQMIQQLRHIH